MRIKAIALAGMFVWLTTVIFGQAAVNLSGTVTGPQDTPVEGASLKLYLISIEGDNQPSYSISPLGETKSDAQGKFAFSMEAPKTDRPAFYTCIGSKEGLSCGWKTLLQDNQTLDIKLTEPQKMIGFIQEPDGRGIADVQVRLVFLGIKGQESNFTLGLEPMDEFVTKTCDQGRFEFNRLPEGASAEILAQKEGRGILHTLTSDLNLESGLTYQAGQTEIMLTMPKPCTISGMVMTQEGQKPVEGISIGAVQANFPINLLGLKPIVSAADGTFQISNLPPGKYILNIVDNSDWIAEPVTVDVQGTIGTRILLQKGGLLEVKVIDSATDKTLEGVSVSIRDQASGHSYGCTTDPTGLAKKQLLPGNYEISAYKQGYRHTQNAAVAVIENDKTAAIEIRLGGQQKLTGIVKRPDGKPAENVCIRIMPNQGIPGDIKTDAGGQFSLTWNPEDTGWTDGVYFLLAIDKKNNLAASESLDLEAKEITMTLQAGCRIKGRVLDEAGKPLKGAGAALTFWGGNWGTGLGDDTLKTDAEGRYEFTAIPAGQKFSVNINNVKGYGSGGSRQFIAEPDSADNIITLEDIVLRAADRKLSGQAVDIEGKPLAKVRVNLNGSGQPNESVETDAKGNFKFENVCAGEADIYASYNAGNQYMYGNVSTEGGAEGIKIVLSSQGGYSRYEPRKPASLVGKPLPDLAAYGVQTPADANSVLVFVWDMQQRPSRHFVVELAKQKDILAAHNVAVVLLHAAAIEKEPLDKWLVENQIPFACGTITEDSENATFNLGVQGLPWLILTDGEKVTAEGFMVDELEAKLKTD
jgi:uncharacterized GH25 family protein